MANKGKFRTQENIGPFCQATGCFETASFYVVMKETEEPNYYELLRDAKDFISAKYAVAGGQNGETRSNFKFDGFKMIMYFCLRHENEFKYLIRGSELWISKSCRLRVSQIREKMRS